MKLWRKKGNKETLENDKGETVVVSGRMWKRLNSIELPKIASSLVQGLLLHAAVPNVIKSIDERYKKHGKYPA